MDGVELKVSPDLIKPIIESKIKIAITEAMGGYEKMLEQMIDTFMHQKVDSEGKSNGYSSEKPRIDWLITGMLNEAMKGAVAEFFSNKKDVLQKAILKWFASPKGTSMLMDAIEQGIVKGLTDKWHTSFHVQFTPPNK